MGIKFNPVIFEGLDITGGSELAIGSPIAGADGDSILVTDATGKLAEIALENGELLIGSTGAAPVATTLSGTTDQVTITNGAGSVVISTPQNIAPTSDVTFNSVTTNTIDADGVLTLGAIDAEIINIGNPASTVNLQGDVNIINTTNLDVTNSLIRTNVGGPAASGGGSGIEVEENTLTAGYVKVASDRESWQLKSPARSGTVNIQAPTTGNLLINQELFDSKYDASNPNGYETPAQLDARDTANRDRANHTGTQLASTISDFTEASQDAVGAAVAAGVQDGVTLTYDDVNNRIDTLNTDKGSTAVASHELAADPHPQYETSAEAQAKVDAHANLTNNPHSVTKAQVGLGNVDNTSDLDKPISTATQDALDLKADISSLGDLALLDTVNTAQIDNNSVDNTKLADMAADTIKGRLTSSGDPQDLSVAQVLALLDVETSTQLDARDTANRDRANHTGDQLASTISDFEEAAQDASALMITSATHDGVSVSYNDVLNVLEFINTDKGSTEVGLHEAASDPHPQYATDTDLTNHLNDTVGAHEASAISVSVLPINNVQDVLESLYDGFIPKVTVPYLDNQTNTVIPGVALGNFVKLTIGITKEIVPTVFQYELVSLEMLYDGTLLEWIVQASSVGDNTGVTFNANSSGQLLYSSPNDPGSPTGTITVSGISH